MSGNLGDYHRYQRFPIYPRRRGGAGSGGGGGRPNRRSRRRTADGRHPVEPSGWRGWVIRHLLGWLGDERHRRRP